MPGRVRHVFASPATAFTTPTAALATHTHVVPVPSKLWSAAASVLVTTAIAPTLAATFAYALSNCSGATPAASMVVTVDAPVHRAALH
jgi:hypothetical protein